MNMQDVTQIVARAGADPAFRTDLEKNPKAVFERAGLKLPATVAIKVFANDAKTFHAVLPLPEQGKVLDFVRQANPVAAKVYEKAWGDPAFKQRLMTQPRQAFTEATGVTPPASMNLVAHEDTANTLNIVIPYAAKAGELSDADLEQVAGGKGLSSSCNSSIENVALTGAGITIDATGDGALAGGPIGAAVGFGVGAIGTGLACAGAAIASLFK